MSNGLYIYDFLTLFNYYRLNERPTNQEGAAAAYILCAPVPSVVYDYLPSYLASDLVDNKLDHLIRDPVMSVESITALQTISQDESTVPANGYLFYPNHGYSMGVCAHRALSAIGVVVNDYDYFGSMGYDHTKFGVDYRIFLKLLAIVPPHIYRLYQHRTNTPMFTDNLVRDLTRSYPTKDHHLYRPIILHLYDDHVAFAVDQTYLENQLSFHSVLPTTPYPRAALEEKYPKNTGRAGAKILMDWPSLTAEYRSNNTTRHMVQALLNGDNDWEFTIAYNICLLQYITVTGQDLSTWFRARSRTGRSVLNLPFLDAVKTLKALHTTGRMTASLIGYSRFAVPTHTNREWGDGIYGLDTLPGRSEKYKADFMAECLMRVVDPVIRGVPVLSTDRTRFEFSQRLYQKYLDEAVSETVGNIIVSQPKLIDFSTWYSERLFWGASGGSPGTKVEWDTGERLRLNKRGALLATPEKNVRSMWSRANDAIQWSVGTLKYESGKLRYILTTGLYNYISQAYILDNFDRNIREDSWYSSVHAGPMRVANHIRRLADLRTGVATMFDFSDYNLEHTVRQMVAIYERVTSVLLSTGKSGTPSQIYAEVVNDMQAALQYIVTARQNTYLNDKQSGLVARIVRGLQSGERGTSFINTMCNMVDSKLVDKVALQLLGRSVISHQGDRVGDDVFTKNPDMLSAIMMCALFNLLGAAGQLYKITCEYCSQEIPGKGEFLRYSYDGYTNSVRGYAIRAMVGFTHGEFFSEPIPAIFERAATLVEQRSKLQRRGLNLPASLFQQNVLRNATITHTDENGKKRRITPDLRYTLIPSAFGGLGVSRAEDSGNLVTGGESFCTRLSTSTQRLSICVPSGEGKTTLARLYPSLFIDHEALTRPLILNRLREVASATGIWDECNTYLRDVASEHDEKRDDSRILLTWSAETNPHTRKISKALLRSQPTRIRANTANRKVIIRSMPKRIVYCQSFAELASQALTIAGNAVVLDSTDYRVTTVSNPLALPRLELRVRNPATTIHRLRPNLKDYQTLHQLGLDRVDIGQSVLKSVLSGGYPSDKLRSAIDKYSADLVEWARHIVFGDMVIRPSIRTFGSNFIHRALSTFTHSIGYRGNLTAGFDINHPFILNSEGYPMSQRIIHNHDVFPRLVKAAGFTVADAFTQAVMSSPPTPGLYGNIGRLHSFLTRIVSNRRHSVLGQHLSTISGSDAPDNIIKLIENIVVPGDLSAAANLYDYLSGGLSLIPPRNLYNDGADLTTTMRDTILSTIEQDPRIFREIMKLPPHILVLTVYVLESQLSDLIHKLILNQAHMTLKD